MIGLLKFVGLGPATFVWVGVSTVGLALGVVGLAAALVVAPVAFFALPAVSRR